MNITKALLKRAGSNLVSIAGYLSTAATFFPAISRIRGYLLPVTLTLIVVGILKGALSVIEDISASKDSEMERLREKKDQEIKVLTVSTAQEVNALTVSKDKEIDALKSAHDNEVSSLKRLISQQGQRITQLSRKLYDEDLERTAREVLTKMGTGGRPVLIDLMKKGQVEVGRAVSDKLSLEATNNVLAIAMQGGVVQQHRDRHAAMSWDYWLINPQYRPVLEHVLYE